MSGEGSPGSSYPTGETGETREKSDRLTLTSDMSISDVRETLRIAEDIEVAEDLIARNQAELTEKSRVYIGPLSPNIFQEYPNLECIYASGGKITRSELEIGGIDKEQLGKRVEAARGVKINEYAQAMLDGSDFQTAKKAEKIQLVRLKAWDLGFNDPATFDQICARAEEFGLEPCPAEAALWLCLRNAEQPLTEAGGYAYSVAMKPIEPLYGGGPRIFGLFRDPVLNDGDLCLNEELSDTGHGWFPGNEFVFRLRNVSQEA